jgi:glycosyltransferase involved in cell wall biosynthesis
VTPAVSIGIDAHSAEREGEGNSTYSRGLISALLADGGDDRFTLFAGDPDHAFYRTLVSPGRHRTVRVVQGRGLARYGWTLARAAARARVEALHTQYTAPRTYRGPLIVTVHDLGFLHVPGSFSPGLRMALRALVPRSMARASRIITDSEFSRRDMVASYGVSPDKIAVIPLAADARFRPLATDDITPVLDRYGLRPGFLFSLGRLNRRKNLEGLLMAYGRLRADAVSAPPLVIGGKPDIGVEAVVRRARLSVGGAGVIFAGLIPDGDLPAFYNGAACFVYPSLFEGFGLPVLEAMACGSPVVASNRAALPELVADAGLLVDPEAVDGLAAAIVRVLVDGALARALRARGLARSRQYSWAETARQTLAVYRGAVRR